MDIDYKKIAEKYKDYVISMRRDFHMHPELSGEEIYTSNRICEELDRLDIRYEQIEGYNIVGVIDTGKPGKSIAVRADIDALPMEEKNDIEYKSIFEGMMHSCGHDAHTAVLLTTAAMILEIKNNLSGKIYFCFQSGEEQGLGAPEIVNFLKKQGWVDCVIGAHVFSFLEKGSMVINDENFLAGSLSWKVKILGKGGHGSAPHLAIDPLAPACDMLLRFKSLPVNRLDTLDAYVVNPCMISGGTAPNIIPDQAEVSGTIRYFNREGVNNLILLMETIARDISSSYGAESIFEWEDVGNPVINNSRAAALGREVANEMKLNLFQKIFMGSDNFGDFLVEFPGLYVGIGAGNKEKGIDKYQHNPYFDIDEECLPMICEFFIRYIVQLGRKGL